MTLRNTLSTPGELAAFHHQPINCRASTYPDPQQIAHRGPKRVMSQDETCLKPTFFSKPYCVELAGRIILEDRFPFASGGNSNIYRGQLLLCDTPPIQVAMKMLRVCDDDVDQLDRRLRREVEIWRRLKHRNVLPFFGVCDDIAPRPMLISIFCHFGHVGTYLKTHPWANKDELVYGVASGLHYLHENDIVHGDLKQQNVLVDPSNVPCICDFGLSRMTTRTGFTTLNVGTVPYLAPELFFVLDAEDAKVPLSRTTKYSDVYSLGLLVVEILTSEQLKRRPSRVFVKLEDLSALRPQRSDHAAGKITNEMWDLLDRCWASNPEFRPTSGDILNSLRFLGIDARA
ncbi:kinase-like domain-containing protein [Mycena haematopus]|nr:kinase-like domain-containing protein [Mycena haematopus]